MHGRVERTRRVSIPEYTLGGTDRKRPAHKSNLDPALHVEGKRETEKASATPDSSAWNKSKDGRKTKRATAPRVHFVSSSRLTPLRLCSQSLPSSGLSSVERFIVRFVPSVVHTVVIPCTMFRCILGPVSTRSSCPIPR